MDGAVAHIAGVYEFVNEIEEAAMNIAGWPGSRVAACATRQNPAAFHYCQEKCEWRPADQLILSILVSPLFGL